MIRHVSGALALLAPVCLLAACGNSTVAAPLPSSVGQFAPEMTPATAQRPFSFGEYAARWNGSAGCGWDTGVDDLHAETFTVDQQLTVTSFTPTDVSGLTFGQPSYSVMPATVDGHRNAFGGGDWESTAPSDQYDSRKESNWAGRQPLVGATLKPHTTYVLFEQIQIPTSGGQVDRFTIDWTSASGQPGTSVWRDPLKWAQHC